MGRALCALLSAKQVQFVLIEVDADLTAQADRLGYLYIHGDAMSEQILRRARLDGAKGLASCLPSDANNVFVALSARAENESLTIIARAENMETQAKLHRAGADSVICPPVIGAARITQMLLQPAVGELLEMAVGTEEDLEISKVSMGQLPRAMGKSLRELELPARTGLMVIAVMRGDGKRHFNPSPDWRFEQDDDLIVTGASGGITRLVELLGPEPQI